MVGNLLTNAVDHNDTEGLCVLISATKRADDDTAIVRTADDGKGIPEGTSDRIFDRDATGHTTSAGSGFGLFFVRSMVQSYGGDVWAENNDAGGATFVLELPLANATTPA